MPGGLKPARARIVVDQVAVKPAVPVLERMDVDEAKRQALAAATIGSEAPFERPTLEGLKPHHQVREVLMPSADMDRQGRLRVALMAPD